MTMKDEKMVAGLSCSDVLARLSDYLDGDLSADERARVEAHLRACDGCARFGGELRATIRALREHLGVTPEVPRALQERLRVSIDEDLA